MDSKGPKYQLGDFTVKIGSVSLGPSFRGILIEVEYGPCVVPSFCWEMLKEFMGSFMIPPRDPHPYLQGKMNDVFSPVDVINQYNDHFNNFRRMATTATGIATPVQQPGTDRSTPLNNSMNPAQPVSVGKS
jgi:mediator of RNA polymerase II transcription subunit 20